MFEKLSINRLKQELYNLNHDLSSEWNDKVGMSYRTYISDEKRLTTDIEYIVKKVNEKFEYIDNIKVERFKNNYNNYKAKFEQLSRGN